MKKVSKSNLNSSYISKTRIGVLCVSMMGMAALAITPSYAAIAKYFAASNTMVQMLTSLPNLFMMIAGILMGKLTVTKIHEKTLTIAAIVLVIIGGLLPLAFHNSLPFLLFCSCLVGLGQGSCTNLSQVLITRMLPENIRQSTMGQTTTFTNIGGIIFIMGGGSLAAHSWVNNYYIYIFSVLVLLVVLLWVPYNPLPVDNESKTTNQKVHIKLNKYVFWCAAGAFCTMLLNNVLNNNIAMFVVQNHMGATSQAALTSTISLVGGMLCGLIVGMLGKKFKYSTIAISFLVYGFSYLLIAYGGSLLTAFIGSFLVGAAMSVAMGQFPYLISISLDKESVSMGLGVYAAINAIGGVVSPFVINPLTNAFSSIGMNVFSIAGILALIIAVIVWLGKFQRKLVDNAKH